MFFGEHVVQWGSADPLHPLLPRGFLGGVPGSLHKGEAGDPLEPTTRRGKAEKGGAPKGGVPKPRKKGALKGGAPNGGGPKIYFSSPCVNINAFVPGYSSRLYDNCGSSKWRRVFT